jgi:benzoyl-CoA-dihydrodiol lyase
MDHGEARQLTFETSPDQYRHWVLDVDGAVARLTLNVDRFGGLDPSIELKGNSYDITVDIELADAVQRLRFEHPGVCAVVITSGDARLFCSGANIHTLARSSHAHKVNFCKYTNETRLYIEEASAEAGQRYIAACNGATAGGGYELALACDEILLVDDGSSAVSLPEVPLLGVLPGTGGLTRLTDKRRVRPDLIDTFATLAEGVRGKRALQWGLVDAIAPRSGFEAAVAARVEAAIDAAATAAGEPPVHLDHLDPDADEGGIRYRYVALAFDPAARVATLTVTAPQDAASAGRGTADWWPLRMARELDDAINRLRFNHPTFGLVMVRTAGDASAAHEAGAELAAPDGDRLTRETRSLLGRALRRLDITARSMFAIVDAESCFAGPLFELLLTADRSYVLDGDGVACWPGRLSAGLLPRWDGLSRLQARFLARPELATAVLDAAAFGPIATADIDRLGLATVFVDDIDFEDTVRVAIEERASLSPDALTGMEASTRFAGPETMATRIFGRLSAWQNWIFTRPNATGEAGALTLYGKPKRPRFDFTRT